MQLPPLRNPSLTEGFQNFSADQIKDASSTFSQEVSLKENGLAEAQKTRVVPKEQVAESKNLQAAQLQQGLPIDAHANQQSDAAEQCIDEGFELGRHLSNDRIKTSKLLLDLSLRTMDPDEKQAGNQADIADEKNEKSPPSLSGGTCKKFMEIDDSCLTDSDEESTQETFSQHQGSHPFQVSDGTQATGVLSETITRRDTSFFGQNVMSPNQKLAVLNGRTHQQSNKRKQAPKEPSKVEQARKKRARQAHPDSTNKKDVMSYIRNHTPLPLPILEREFHNASHSPHLTAIYYMLSTYVKIDEPKPSFQAFLESKKITHSMYRKKSQGETETSIEHCKQQYKDDVAKQDMFSQSTAFYINNTYKNLPQGNVILVEMEGLQTAFSLNSNGQPITTAARVEDGICFSEIKIGDDSNSHQGNLGLIFEIYYQCETKVDYKQETTQSRDARAAKRAAQVEIFKDRAPKRAKPAQAQSVSGAKSDGPTAPRKIDPANQELRRLEDAFNQREFGIKTRSYPSQATATDKCSERAVASSSENELSKIHKTKNTYQELNEQIFQFLKDPSRSITLPSPGSNRVFNSLFTFLKSLETLKFNSAFEALLKRPEKIMQSRKDCVQIYQNKCVQEKERAFPIDGNEEYFLAVEYGKDTIATMNFKMDAEKTKITKASVDDRGIGRTVFDDYKTDDKYQNVTAQFRESAK